MKNILGIYQKILEGFIKLNNKIHTDIFDKISQSRSINASFGNSKYNYLYKKTTSGSQYKLFFKEAPYFAIDGVVQIASSFKPIYFSTNQEAWIAVAIYNSNLFNIWWVSLSDGRNVTSKETDSIGVPNQIWKSLELMNLSKKLMNDLESKSERVIYNKKKGCTEYDLFTPRLSKPIIDDIDKELSKYYGFTEEELDFIINYDIKYRMGDELNE